MEIRVIKVKISMMGSIAGERFQSPTEYPAERQREGCGQKLGIFCQGHCCDASCFAVLADLYSSCQLFGSAPSWLRAHLSELKPHSPKHPHSGSARGRGLYDEGEKAAFLRTWGSSTPPPLEVSPGKEDAAFQEAEGAAMRADREFSCKSDRKSGSFFGLGSVLVALIFL